MSKGGAATDAGAVWRQNLQELSELLPRLHAMEGDIRRMGQALMDCWNAGGKVLFAGNGGSAAGAMHFTEELLIRFKKTRRPLAAIALCDPTVLTCAANDFGYDEVFARQIQGLGKPGDLLVVMSTSGNSQNLVRAVQAARQQQMQTIAMLGEHGGKLRGACDLELLVPTPVAHHVQEGHKLIYHALCQWIDTQVD
jgi:D-sedoheptulose 7-phosphate isomerase